MTEKNFMATLKEIVTYGTAQMQLDTRKRVTGKNDASKVNEFMSNQHGCLSQFVSMMV